MTDTTEEILPTDDYLVHELAGRRQRAERWEAALRAFEELYRRHADELLLFLAARLPGEEVEAVHQEVWKQVWQHDPNPTKKGSFGAWLQRIARDEVAAHLANRSGFTLRNLGGMTIPGANELRYSIIDRRRMEMMRDSLARLDNDLAAVVHRRLSGENFEVISFDLDVDVEQAREMFERGKALMSVYLQRVAAQTS